MLIRDFVKNILKSKNYIPRDVEEYRNNHYIQLPAQFDPEQVHILNDVELNNMWGIYKNGLLIDVKPRNIKLSLDENRQIAYSCRYIKSDDIVYDLCNVASVCSMHIPNYIGSEIYTVRDLSYLLQMRAKDIVEPQLSTAIVYKACDLMIASNISYTKVDYIRLIDQLKIVGCFEYAKYLRSQLEEKLPMMTDDDYCIKHRNYENINEAIKTGTDYVEIGYLNATCEECAKYQGRVYCLSGKDHRLPQLPEFIRRNGIIHAGCQHTIVPFYFSGNDKIQKAELKADGTVEVQYLDVFVNSTRPFVDDRSFAQKESYKKLLIRQQRKGEKMSDNYIQRKGEYAWLCLNLPELAPKSMSGYTRMKNAKSKNYIKLKKHAKELGKELQD